MMNGKRRLELCWVGKEERPRLEPRILIEEPEKSCHAVAKADGDLFDNILIKGDNLLALRALEDQFTGKVKCVFIDPPYNTGSAFEHYDDGIEHSLWLSLMRNRIELIYRLMSDDGSLWITIDDNEAHYLKIICDEIFGRKNFVASIAWQKVFAKKNKALISGSHDHILLFTKNISLWQRNLLPREDNALSAFKNPDNDKRGLWQSVAYSVQSEDSERRKAYRYPVKLPSGREVLPPTGRHWNGLPTRTEELRKDNRLWFGKDGDNPPRIKVFLSEVQDGIVPDTWWPHDFAGSNQDSKKEMLELLPGEEPFGTPKPERLLFRILTISTNRGDIVLDSFAGSGTTGAVAHKMGRRWIMVELGDHAETHILPRLKKVVDGGDPNGVTDAAGWKGGGGFRFYRLAPSLLERDKWGNWIISKDYNPTMLAEAMCKHMGFTYSPSQDIAEYWRHGYSSERDFIYVTTASLTHDQVKAMSLDVGRDRTLLICCKAFNARPSDFENLTIKKIPHAILTRCEWGRDDYSLEITKLPIVQRDAEVNGDAASLIETKSTRRAGADQPTLFGDGEA